MKVQLKYCGNRTYEDYLLVRESLATHIGVIFVAASKRFVSPDQVKSWLDKSPKREDQKLVGVFVNQELETLKAHLQTLELNVVQLHGEESPSYIKELRKIFGGEIWKVIHHAEGAEQKMKAYLGLVDAFLVDTKVSGQWGGTGMTFDWEAIPLYINQAHQLDVPCFIAGGIHPKNVSDLLKYNPDGIDLASGIEESEQKSLKYIQAIERKVVPE